MNLPAKAASFALVSEVLLLPFLFVWQHALPLTHMLGFILVWDREPVFEFSAGGYVIMLVANIAVLFVFWLLVLLLFRGGHILFHRLRHHSPSVAP
jgi:hypothetical protein